MFDTSRRWPFNLDRPGNWFIVAAIVILIAAATLIDSAVAAWAKAAPEIVVGIFYVITRAGMSDWFLIPTLIIAFLSRVALMAIGPSKLRLFMVELAAVNAFMFAGAAVPGLVANLIKRLLGRARPLFLDQYGIFHFEPITTDWRFQSFPSGDTTTMFAIAVVVAALEPRLRYWAFGAAALVGIARIMVGMHFPSDVLAGMVLGTVGAYAVRNFWLSRDWLFMRTKAGAIVRKPAWWQV